MTNLEYTSIINQEFRNAKPKRPQRRQPAAIAILEDESALQTAVADKKEGLAGPCRPAQRRSRIARPTSQSTRLASTLKHAEGHNPQDETKHGIVPKSVVAHQAQSKIPGGTITALQVKRAGQIQPRQTIVESKNTIKQVYVRVSLGEIDRFDSNPHTTDVSGRPTGKENVAPGEETVGLTQSSMSYRSKLKTIEDKSHSLSVREQAVPVLQSGRRILYKDELHRSPPFSSEPPILRPAFTLVDLFSPLKQVLEEDSSIRRESQDSSSVSLSVSTSFSSFEQTSHDDAQVRSQSKSILSASSPEATLGAPLRPPSTKSCSIRQDVENQDTYQSISTISSSTKHTKRESSNRCHSESATSTISISHPNSVASAAAETSSATSATQKIVESKQLNDRENALLAIHNPALNRTTSLDRDETAVTTALNRFLAQGTPQHNFDAEKTESQSMAVSICQQSSTIQLSKNLFELVQHGSLQMSKAASEATDIVKDLALKRRWTDLWMCSINNQTLTVVAQTLIGKSIKGQSEVGAGVQSLNRGAHRRSLLAYLQGHFLLREDIETPVGTSTRHNTRLHRNLMLLWTLEQTNQSRALFMRTSPHKSTVSVLAELCALLLPNVSDVQRRLSRIGFNLTHEHTAIDELSFQVRNIAVDLRDGLILGKVVDIMRGTHDAVDAGQKDDLVRSLIYPCRTRVQRLINVRQVLDVVLSLVKCKRLVHIQAEDIVDGHQEKTIIILQTLLEERDSRIAG